MTFRQFASAALLFPATVLVGITNLLLGSYEREPKGKIKTDSDGNSLVKPGLLGYILDGIKDVGRGISNFLYNNRQEIAVAFWASLVLAGVAALTVFLWPAALTAVTTFTIAGLSIDGVVGDNVVAQIGAVAALTAAANSLAVYTAAAVANTISAISSFFASRSTTTPRPGPSNEVTFTAKNGANEGSSSKLKSLGNPTPFIENQKLGAEKNPDHTTIFNRAKDVKDAKNASHHGSEEVSHDSPKVSMVTN